MPAKELPAAGQLLDYHNDQWLLNKTEDLSIQTSSGSLAIAVASTALSDQQLSAVKRPNGELRLLYNVSFFEAVDPLGRSLFTSSNASGSQQGEGRSLMISNRHRTAWMMVNPLIKTQQGEGSAAYVWRGENRQSLYYSANTLFRGGDISEDGLFYAVATYGPEESKATVYDAWGNALVSVDLEQRFDVQGIEISHDGEFFTVYNDRRAMVYGIPSGKLYGSTSYRNTLLAVELDPKTLKLYALLGKIGGQKIEQAQLQMVDFNARKIEKQDVEQSLEVLSASLPVSLVMNKQGQLQTVGLKSDLLIK